MYTRELVEEWIADDPDAHTAQEVRDLLALAEDGDRGASAELEDRFSGMLTFGTAGLRGRMGGGPNRMNRAVVLRAAAGLAHYLQRLLPGGYQMVIGYDARHGSRQFAVDTAAVVEAAGGHALIFDQALPTPLAAFALRYLNADAAVVVTASHNPKDDNGYKVYLGGRAVSDHGQGAQIVSPFDAHIFNEIQKVGSVASIPRAESGWEWIGEDIVDAYMDRLVEIVPSGDRSLRIVTTAMHGVGGDLMVRALNAVGFMDVHSVPEQHNPDPDFPTVTFPNPEEPGALDMAVALAQSVDADLILANDPDADRCSAAIPTESGWRQLTGNEVGALLGEQAARDNAGHPEAVLANSVVSSRLLARLADKFGTSHRRTLTGFKWISRVPGLVFGFEEALGYCTDPRYVRDKDGITACARLAALAAQRPLQQILDDQAYELGLHASAPLTIRVDDVAVIAQGMRNLRERPPAMIAGSPVVLAQDLAKGSDELPPTDGLLYLTDAKDQVVVRPSGTEPKLKCYIEVIIPVANDLAAARQEAEIRLERIRADMRTAIGV